MMRIFWLGLAFMSLIPIGDSLVFQSAPGNYIELVWRIFAHVCVSFGAAWALVGRREVER